MAIRLSGLTSGLDTDAIVQELVSAYSLKTQKYEKASTKLTWKQDIWKNLNTKIYGLYTNVSNLRYSSAYNLRKTTVSDSSKVSVTASSDAIAGTQKLEIKQTAQAAYITGNELGSKITKDSKMSDLGYYRINTEFVVRSSDGEEKAIKITKNTTISEVLDQLKEAGCNASFDENNKRFFVSSKQSGKEGNFDLVAYSSNARKALQVLGLDIAQVEYDENGLKQLTSAAGEYADVYNNFYNGALKDVSVKDGYTNYQPAADILEDYTVEKDDDENLVIKLAKEHSVKAETKVYASVSNEGATDEQTPLEEDTIITLLGSEFTDKDGNTWQQVIYGDPDDSTKMKAGYIQVAGKDDANNSITRESVIGESDKTDVQEVEIIVSETNEDTNVTTNRKQLQIKNADGTVTPFDIWANATIETKNTDPDTGEETVTESVELRKLTDSANANKYLDIVEVEGEDGQKSYKLAILDIDQYIDNEVAAYNKLQNSGNYKESNSADNVWGLNQWNINLNLKDVEIADTERTYTKAEELYEARTAHDKLYNALSAYGVTQEKLLELEQNLYGGQYLSANQVKADEVAAALGVSDANKDKVAEILNKQIDNLKLTADYHKDRADAYKDYNETLTGLNAQKDADGNDIGSVVNQMAEALGITDTDIKNKLENALYNNRGSSVTDANGKTTTNSLFNATNGTLDVDELNKVLGTSFDENDLTDGGDKENLKAAENILKSNLSDIKTVVNYNKDKAAGVEDVYKGGTGSEYFYTASINDIRVTIDKANGNLQKLYEEREALSAGAAEIQAKMDANPCADLIAQSKIKEDDDSRTNAERLEVLKKDALYKLKQAMTIAEDPEAVNGSATKVEGQDAIIKLNGVEYTGSDNSFTIGGLTINAYATTKEGEQIDITTSVDTQGIYDKIKDFLTEYNNVINEMCKLYNAEYNKDYEPLTDEEKEAMSEDQIEKWETKIKDSLLRRDTTLNSIMSTMVNSMAQTFQINGETLSLSTFGISTLGFLNAAENEHYAYHIDGDEDDENTEGKDDKLMKAIEEDPEQVMEFMKKLTSNLYTAIDNKMKSTELSSAYKVYNDKEMDKEISNYASIISKWEDKIADKEDYYYKKFTQMETALAKLNNQTSSISGLLGQ